MCRKKLILILGLLIYFIVLFIILRYKNIISETEFKMKPTINDNSQKYSMTRVALTFTYESENSKSNICYRMLETIYYEEIPEKVNGLHTEAFNVLFPVDYMDSCKKMKVQNWDAAIYKKGKLAYLCWTHSPEISYVIEYNSKIVSDYEIIKMAESAKLME